MALTVPTAPLTNAITRRKASGFTVVETDADIELGRVGRKNAAVPAMLK